MALAFRKLHPLFVAEVSPIDLRRVRDEETLACIRAGMDEFAVLVFRDQPFADTEHLVASHASRIIDWPVPEGRLFLRDLIEHATQRQFMYHHEWRVGDLVIWDNRATMHRAMPFDDTRYKRELRRVTTLDILEPAPVASRA